MWMMGCSDVSDSFIGRKVRPHIPRPSIMNPPISPSTSNITNVATTTVNHPYLGRIHGGDLLVYNHHLLTEQSKREFDVPTLVSSRWNPTPEQLQTLEELYRRGTRTPSAEQIQHITAQLRRFGKIEGKNVFYWFQNHKARERQKRRRRSEISEEDDPQMPLQQAQNLDNKEPGSSRASCGDQPEDKNYWGFSSVTSTVTEVRDYQESVLMQRGDRADGAERIQFDHEQGHVQNRRFLNSRVPTWLPSSSSPVFTTTTTSPTLGTLMTHDLNMFVKTQREYEEKKQIQESPTLQLFPVRKDDEDGANQDDKESESQCKELMNTNCSPKQFFEFL